MSCQKSKIDEFNSTGHDPHLKLPMSVSDFVRLAVADRKDGTYGVASLRSTSTYTPGQAVHYLNQGLNYAYCRPNENYAMYQSIADTLFIPVDTGTIVQEVDLLDVFDHIAVMAGNFYHSVADTTKQPFNFEVWAYDEIQTEGIPIIAVFTMGLGSCGSLNSYPYDTSDEWYISPETGNCYLQVQGNDAMDHWRCDLNANLNYRDKFTAYYFTDRYSVCFDPQGGTNCEGFEIDFAASNLYVEDDDLLNPNDPTPYDNWYDYLLFYNTEWNSNYHTCVINPEMDFYYEEMATLSVDYCPQGKVVGKHEVGSQLLLGAKSTWFALMRVDYFTRNIVTLEEDYAPVNLPCTNC